MLRLNVENIIEKGDIMTTDKCKDSKYVVLVCIMSVLLILGSTIVKFNYIDAAYLLFIGICVMRYFIICHKG